MTRHLSALPLLLLVILVAGPALARDRWTPAQAQDWQTRTGWLVGANFIPSTAINQLEMWQAASFDAKTIDRELKLASRLGFNSVRVFLHDLLWQTEGGAYLRRIDEFLALARKHKIGVMLVIFDSVWDPQPAPGPQRPPTPGVHNPGWVQSPGAAVLRDPVRVAALEGYVKGVIGYFARDPRVHAWDLVNEPDNLNRNSYGSKEPPEKDRLVLALLQHAFRWAREMNPTQPLTAGVWRDKPWHDERLSAVDRFILEASDVITFHDYGDAESMKESLRTLSRFGRPLLCTEYMARPNSTFDPILDVLGGARAGGYNWGLVAGKTQTQYPWSTWKTPIAGEPSPWHHDIFRPDGTAYDETEVRYIRAAIRKHRKR